MKRVVLSIIAVAAALVTVSCNKEQAFDSGDIAKVTYTVAGPQMVATKAMGTIGSAYTLYYEVRLFDGSTLGGKLEGAGLSGSKTVGAAEWPATVQFDLARGKQYKILFWAQSNSAPTGLFTASDLTAIAIDYTKMAANNEECDAFSGFDVITPSGATAASATLHRPFALVNLGTSDAAQFKTASGGVVVGNVSAKISGDIAKKFNVANGTASETIEAFTAAAAPIDAFDKKTLALSGTDTYNYLSAVYVLPLTASSNIDVEYTIKDSQETPADITSLKVTNVPIKTNYRTNITGKLLTGSTTYNISVDQAFAGNTNKAVGPTFASVAALNEYFETLLDNADNGNIDPETVTLTAVGTLPTGMETPTIYLPKVTENIQILMPVNDPALDLIISYADGATDEQKPANLYFYASNIKTLTADITSTHFELISGSIVNTEAVVSTSTGTFVIQQGAKVGNAVIKQGNAVVDGTVDAVEVAAGASADGQGAPVEVFLSNESAVKQIELNAPTDVVVEQPKDNIDESNTENKVEVLVKVDDCSAKAQNGGQIYVKVAAGVTCEVIADGEDSAAKVGEAGEGAIIDAQTNDGGKIETTPDTAGAIKYYVAQIGETKYETIEEAVEAVKDGETIVVLSDITQDDGILFDKANVSAKLNLNNKTITINKGSNVNSRAIRIDNGVLEVFDGSIIAVGAGTTSSNGTGCYGAFRVEANGALDAHDLDLKNSRPWGLNVKVLGGTATLTNVNITSSYGGGIEVTEADLGNKSQIGTATLTNCNFTQTGYFDHCSSTLSVSGGSELTINGGTYTSDNYALYVFSSGGVIIVNDGTFSGNKNGIAIIAAIDTNTYPEYTGGLQIKGGSFSGGFNITSPAYMEVTGGTFSADPSAFVPKATHHVETVTINNETWYAVLEGVDYIFEDGVVTVNTASGLSYVSQNYADFRDEQHNLTIKLNNDINMTGKAFNSFKVNNYTSAQKEIVLFTFDGQNHTITGMENMLIAETWAGKSAVDVKDLTIADSYIVEDENDSKETVGVGAICGWPQASQYFYMTNVHVINSSIIGGHWTGGLVGIASGYDNPSDGPVKEGIIVTGCSVEGCTIKGKGSAGSLVGHAAANEATTWEITDFTAINNDVLNSGTKTDRTGALIGTLGTTRGVSTAYPDAKVGVYFTSPLVVSGNKVLGVENDVKKVGRKGSFDDDKVFLDGVNVVEEWLGN